MGGIAHISFAGGGVVLPARNPYDRQVLMEHIAERVRTKGEIRVTLDRQCWAVRLNRAVVASSCSACGHPLRAACYSAADGSTAYCVRCAFGEELPPAPVAQAHRTVG